MFFLSKRQRTTRTQGSSVHLPGRQIEEIPIEDDAPLCSTCAALDLYAALRDDIPKRHAISLGCLTDVFKKCDQCGLCRLVTTSIHRMWRLDELPTVNLTGITCGLYTLNHRLYINTSGRPQDVTVALTTAQLPFILEVQLLEEDVSKVGRTIELYARRVGQSVDIGLLKKWIHTCENEHQEKCESVWWRSSGDVLPKNMRVLDVARMAIVSAPPKCRYVALSYVWGGTGEGYWTTRANHKSRNRSGGLDVSVLPATISDTIELVRQLDERYLWIDALCIVQDDPKDKVVQISAMDLIYGNAVFTVFATGSASVRDPLPGIRSCTRDPQQCVVKIQGLHLTLPLTYLSEATTSSVWSQRGWTYQELMLSRRRIFFTTHQVYFECTADMWCEGIISNVGLSRHAPSQHDTGTQGLSKLVLRNGVNQTYLLDYLKIVGKYTQRRLTVESDIVDAIAALLKALTKAYNLAGRDYDKAFRFGMPLAHLTDALLWQPTPDASYVRRAAEGTGAPWPSWAWAGWHGAARYSGVHVFVNIHEGPETYPTSVYETLVQRWYILDDNARPIPQDVQRDTYVREDKQNTSLCMYDPPNGDIDPQHLVKNMPLRPGVLIFRTGSARFHVRRADDVVGADAVADYAIYSILTDTPRPSTLIGRIILPCSTRSPASYEFIVLARAGRCEGLYDENVFRQSYLGCMLHVMAVQKTQDKGIVERVGVGVIFEQAWLKSTSEQKVVFLG